MILVFIVFVSFIQIFLYYIIKKYKLKFPKAIILVLVLLGYYFLFPQYFYPEPKVNNINCGMPILGVLIGFWFFGTIAGLITHGIWLVVRFNNKKIFKRNFKIN